MNSEKIIDRFLQNRGLFPNVFWKYTDQVVFDSDKEKAKLILYRVYGFADIYEVLPPEIDENKIMDYARTFMQMDPYSTVNLWENATKWEK